MNLHEEANTGIQTKYCTQSRQHGELEHDSIYWPLVMDKALV